MWRDVNFEVIGPQRADEPVLSRRVRFHQSWYRAAVLGLAGYGVTPGKNPRPLGSILTDADASEGRNFTSEASESLYKRRRGAGWGVDPVRCTKYLTSSQALTLNILGPMQESSWWAARTLGLLLNRQDFERVTDVWVEFAPRYRSEYLNDMTRIDALIRVRTSLGDELIAIETKYADRFNSRRVNIDRPPCRELASKVGLWRDPDSALMTPRLNQLVRCHALATAVAKDVVGRPTVPTLVVLHHRDDAAPPVLVDEYADHLSVPALVTAHTLDEFVNAANAASSSRVQRHAARALELRYVAETESEEAWQASGDRSLNARKVAVPHSRR